MIFVCSKCDKVTNGAGEVQHKVMCDEVETEKRFCYLGNRLNANEICIDQNEILFLELDNGKKEVKNNI